jgi:hypothetical protein
MRAMAPEPAPSGRASGRSGVVCIAVWVVAVTMGAGPSAAGPLREYVQAVAHLGAYGAFVVAVGLGVASGSLDPSIPQTEWMRDVVILGAGVGQTLAVVWPAWMIVGVSRWWASRGGSPQPVEFTGIFRATWQATVTHVPRYLGLAFLTFVGVRAAEATVDAFLIPHRAVAYGLAGAAWAIHVIVGATLLRMCLAIVDGRVLTLRDAVPGPRTLLRFGVLCELWTTATLLGVTVLLVPGILWALASSFAGLVLVEQHVGFFAALRHSARMTRGLKWRLFKLGALWLPTSVLFGVLRRSAPAGVSATVLPEIFHALLLPAITLLLCMAYRRIGTDRGTVVRAEARAWRWAPDSALALGWTAAAALPTAVLAAQRLIAMCARLNAG